MTDFTLNDHNHNLKYNLIHEFFWGFGIAFHTLYAVVPLFLRELGAPESIAVSTTGLFSILIALPTFIIATLGRNIHHIKKAVILTHIIILMVAFGMGFTFTIFDSEQIQTAWKIYFSYFILYSLSIGIIIPIWAEFLNQSTLKSERGKFFGLGFALNSVGSLAGGFILRFLLSSNIQFPRNFGIGFFILFISLTIGTFMFMFFRVKAHKKEHRHKTVKDFITETKAIVIGHKNFQKYILSRIFFAAYLPGVGLYAIYCQDKFNFDVSQAGIFTIMNVIASGFTSYVVGILGDRMGHKSGMMVAYLFHFIAVLLAVFSQNMLWVYAIFMAIGAGQGAFMPSAMNLIYDFAEERDTKIYMALVDTVLAPFVVIYILSIGYIVRVGNYTLSLYIIGTSLLLGIALLHFVVRDPKRLVEHGFNVDGFSS